MKTTELFIEQVLIGFLLLALAALFCTGDPLGARREAKLDAAGATAFAAAMVGAAYLLGILYDRAADTLLEGLDRHNTLLAAFNRSGEEPPVSFPEGDMRLAVLREGGAVAEHAHYLRTRIRLSRALATLAPALTFAWVARQIGPAAANERGILWLLLVYSAAYIWALARKPYRAPPPGGKRADEHASYRNRFLRKFKQGGEWRMRTGRMLVHDASFWAAVAVLGRAAALGAEHWPAVAGGALATTVAGSVWWRISTTHRRFIARVWRSRLD